jgi:hypothetical protein
VAAMIAIAIDGFLIWGALMVVGLHWWQQAGR